MSFQIIRDDITRVRADAIVNTANPMPIYAGGTDYAIYQAARAERLLEARKVIGEIAPGQAVSTPAFDLNAKYIIHTVGPVWEGGEQGEFEILRSCYRNSLALARELGCRSIAFPLIATGTYGFPKDRALQIAMSVIQPFVMEHSMKVTLVVFSRSAFELSGKVVENIRAYVDENYVEEAKEREYRIDREPQRRQRRGRKDEMIDLCYSPISFYEPPKPKKQPKSGGNAGIDGLLAASDKTFQEKLFEIIDARGLTGPQVYKNYISKQVFSKIQSDREYHPNKFTALALCLSLHLDVDQTQDLIGRAGWTLSPSNRADLVVKGCIINKEYNLVQINLILFDYGCPTLEKIR